MIISSDSKKELEKKLLHICVKEFVRLEMAVNFKIFYCCCLRVSPRCDACCLNQQSMTGSILQTLLDTQIQFLS